jgi:hypothetical protein
MMVTEVVEPTELLLITEPLKVLEPTTVPDLDP